MKKTFTPELIKDIVEATNRLTSSIPKGSEGKAEEEVDGVVLAVSVRTSNEMGFGMNPRQTVSITYGKLVIALDLDVIHLNVDHPNHNYPSNMLRIMLEGGLGEIRERVDVNYLVKVINEQDVTRTINSGSTLGYLSTPRPTDFKVELPGGVVFSRMDKTLSVVKGEESLYVLLSTVPHVIEQHMNQAAHLAISYADDIIHPARTVDTSIESVLLNGVLYIRTGDKSVAYYFDDERTKAVAFRQAAQHFGQGIIHDPNQQYTHLFNNAQPGNYTGF